MIYLLEDDESIRNFVSYALDSAGLETKSFDRPSAFWAATEKEIPRLVLLDIMLPEEDGLQVLRKLRLRRETQNVPVLMLTAKSTEYDKEVGLDSGADDYVAKPFGVMELISRVKALLRRTKMPETSVEREYSACGIYVNTQKHIVRADGREVTLTLKEYELLCLLIGNPGTVYTRDQILRQIWGYDFDGESRTVDVHIRTLRQKLGNCGDRIETVRGIGYRIGGEET
mgnify:CR=1 FL=1